MKTAIVAVALFAAAIGPANAADCYDKAASLYQINADLLRAIAQVESAGDPRAIGLNRDKHGGVVSEDLCAMQINSQHLPRLARLGITRSALLADLCTCVHTGAWLLALEMQTAGYSWQAVGRYHTGPNPLSKARGQRYAWKVFQALEQLSSHRKNS